MNAQTELPRLDVIIPIHNNLRYLRTAVDSALAQLNADVRVLVVDDGSDEPVIDEVASWNDERVTSIRRAQRGGIGAARNTGVRAATSEWLSFLDADDCWPVDRTRSLLAVLRDNRDAVAFGHILNFAADGPVPSPDEIENTEIEKLQAAVCAGGMLLRRGTFDRVGLFDEQLAVGEFIEWMMRARALPIDEYTVSCVSLMRGIHSSSTTRNTSLYADYLEVVARVRAARMANDDSRRS
jgi:GT2 family glycosyltransferase